LCILFLLTKHSVMLTRVPDTTFLFVRSQEDIQRELKKKKILSGKIKNIRENPCGGSRQRAANGAKSTIRQINKANPGILDMHGGKMEVAKQQGTTLFSTNPSSLLTYIHSTPILHLVVVIQASGSNSSSTAAADGPENPCVQRPHPLAIHFVTVPEGSTLLFLLRLVFLFYFI
jgi:hypothetical protein